MKIFKNGVSLFWILFILALAVFLNWLAVYHPQFKTVINNPIYFEHTAQEIIDKKLELPLVIKHLKTPNEVRGIYWTASTAGSQRSDQLLTYMKKTGLNTVVIDLKMDNGALAFIPQNKDFLPYITKNPPIQDVEALVKKLHDQDIYIIARIAVMRDSTLAKVHPEYALKWKGGKLWWDNTGAHWLDPSIPEVADYALKLGENIYQRGFDEVQYDYVRFASDGAIGSIIYPAYRNDQSKIEVMQDFFKRVGGKMKEENIPVSFDLFGMTFWNTDDFNIGQRLLDVWPYTDFVSPMPYPSHYPNGFKGYANPALHPYEIVKMTLDGGAKMLEKEKAIIPEISRLTFRPWLQDFDIGAIYTASLIEAEIKAVRDAGGGGWILWNARNVYEPADYLIGVDKK